jgi:hypothetical protein
VSLIHRLIAAIGLLLLGMAAALFLVGEQGMCLGPIGVTEVQCAMVTGIVPTLGLGVPILGAAIGASVFVLARMPTAVRPGALIMGIFGGVVCGLAFLALRQTTMEGFTSSGSWLSIPRPLDPNALATAVVFGFFLGAYLWWVVSGLTRHRGNA